MGCIPEVVFVRTSKHQPSSASLLSFGFNQLSAIYQEGRKKATSIKMATGTACFHKQVPFHTMIQGAINGTAFTVEGKGLGDGNTGKTTGKWVCTSGKLPMSWATIASTLGYGFKCFGKFPNGLAHFFQEAMPEGYTQERVTRLQGDGFKADSAVMGDSLKGMLPTVERTFPFEEGVKSLMHCVFPMKSGKGYVLATQTTVNRPLGEGRNVALPEPHFTRAEIKQFVDTDDDSDHIIQEEILEGYHLKMLDA